MLFKGKLIKHANHRTRLGAVHSAYRSHITDTSLLHKNRVKKINIKQFYQRVEYIMRPAGLQKFIGLCGQDWIHSTDL